MLHEFPELSSDEIRCFLVDPKGLVRDWWSTGGGCKHVIRKINTYGLVCDGWFALLIFMPGNELTKLQDDLFSEGVTIYFVAT